MIERQCKNCSNQFIIEDEDLDFYDKVSPIINEKKYNIPEPTFCPDCRQQRRLSFRNERTFYKRKCDLCDNPIISIYPADAKMPVYCHKCWWSDKWDPLFYGLDYDFGSKDRPFFEQFKELQDKVPVLNLLHKNVENSEYTHLETDTKNCYMTIGGHFNEDCFYCTYQFHGKDCMDNYWSDECELCYDCFKCFKIYNVKFSFWCFNCSDCDFCYDCKGCTDCVGCVGLRHKKHCFFNEQLSKEEYEKRMKEITYTPKTITLFKQEVQKLWNEMPHPHLIMENCENCLGTYLKNCKNCFNCFELDDTEDCKYCEVGGLGMKDCYDGTRTGYETELCYENMAGTFLKNCLFTNFSFDNHYFCMYIDNCFSTKYLFGCSGLHNKKYCILNKQYLKEEWEELVPKIIDHMRSTGEWGEFFSSTLSAFGYNETVANEYFPLIKEEALKKGLKWRDEDPKNYKPPTNEILACDECGKNYRIVAKENQFYKRMKLPIPVKCPNCRHAERMKQWRNPRHFYDRNCLKCGIDVKSTYSLDRPEKVYCEKCYLQEIV